MSKKDKKFIFDKWDYNAKPMTCEEYVTANLEKNYSEGQIEELNRKTRNIIEATAKLFTTLNEKGIISDEDIIQYFEG